MSDERQRALRFGPAILLLGAACSAGTPPPTNAPASDAPAARDAADEGTPDALRAEDVAREETPAQDAVSTEVLAAPDAPAAPDVTSAMDVGAVDVAPVPDTIAVEAGACAAPQTSCPTDGGPPVCTDLRGDTQHCGRCDVACCFGLRCLEGVCTSVRCPPLQTPCTASTPTAAGCYDAPCRELLSDDAHCGACGRACAEGAFCLRGRCEG